MNNLKCRICFKIFEKEQRIPKILTKCGHTFCSFCLKTLLNENNQFRCPEDNKLYENIPSIDDFPTNNMILTLLKDLSEVGPEKCETHNKELEYFCMTHLVE